MKQQMNVFQGINTTFSTTVQMYLVGTSLWHAVSAWVAPLAAPHLYPPSHRSFAMLTSPCLTPDAFVS